MINLFILKPNHKSHLIISYRVWITKRPVGSSIVLFNSPAAAWPQAKKSSSREHVSGRALVWFAAPRNSEIVTASSRAETEKQEGSCVCAVDCYHPRWMTTVFGGTMGRSTRGGWALLLSWAYIAACKMAKYWKYFLFGKVKLILPHLVLLVGDWRGAIRQRKGATKDTCPSSPLSCPYRGKPRKKLVSCSGKTTVSLL